MGMSAGTGGGGERYRAVSEINVTPLVDIMLVLLIIFMVTAPLLNQGVDVNLPHGQANPLASDKEPIVVSVTADGVPHLENRAVSVEELTAKMVAIKQTNPELTVYVRGDSAADYGAVVKVMVQLQQAGVVRVGLVTTDAATSKGTKKSQPSRSDKSTKPHG